MKRSESIKTITAALKDFHSKVGKINKGSLNPHFKSKYANLSDILDVITNPLVECGLTFAQFPEGNISLITLLIHPESGEYIESEFNLELVKKDAQSVGSALTYMRRYALAAILGLNIGDDDDGEAATKASEQPVTASSGTERPWLDKGSKKYAMVVEKLKNKQTTVSQVGQYFKLNKEVREELNQIVSANGTEA